MRKLFTILFSVVSISCFAQRGFVKGTNDTIWYYDGVGERVVINKPTVLSASTLNDSTVVIRTVINAKASLTGSEVITGKTLGMFNYAADAGANDSYVISLSPAPASYTTGMVVIFKANTANTTGCTINVNSLGAKTIVKRVSTTPATGDILQNMFCWLVYDGTNFVLLNPVVN